MKSEFALSVLVFGLRHVICGFLKKGGIISITAQNKVDPASLAVTDQLIWSQGKQRLTPDYVPFHDMTFVQIFFLLQFFVTYYIVNKKKFHKINFSQKKI